LALAGCSSGQPESKWASDDIEYKLAAIAGDSLTDSSIDRYETALDRAADACPDSRSEVADFVVAGVMTADEVGVDTTILELLEAVPTLASDLPIPSCDEVVVLIVSAMR
jgi:hypothetical protein